MDVQRYLLKKAENQARFVKQDGVWFLELDKFETDFGKLVEPERVRVGLKQLQALRKETEAEIANLDARVDEISAAKAKQEKHLADIDILIADLQAALGG